MDVPGSGIITFKVTIHGNPCKHGTGDLQDFVLTLALLLKGTQEDKLKWVFQLYDLNGDGWISREEMEDITHSVGKKILSVSNPYLGQYFQVFDLLDKTRDETEDLDRMVVKQRVGLVWQALDKGNDGLISQDSFVAFCQQLHKQRE